MCIFEDCWSKADKAIWGSFYWLFEKESRQHEKYLTQEFFWFWPIIPHDLSHLVGIGCFSFSRNWLLPFFLLFPALLVIIKQVHLVFWNLNVQSFTLYIWMEKFSIWSANVQRNPKFTYIDVFSFSSKNPRRTLEPL